MVRVTIGNTFLQRNKDRVLDLYISLGCTEAWKILICEEPALKRTQLESFKAKHLKGASCRRSARMGKVNLSCLEDSQIASGLLGFVLGDGFVDGKTVGFCSTDAEVIFEIRDLLQAENLVCWGGLDKKEASLRVTDPDLAAWFLSRGIWENKSGLDSWDMRGLKIPAGGDWNFLRAWWETDGWLSAGFSWVNNSSGFMDYMRSWLRERGVKATRSHSGKRKYPILQVDALLEAWRLRELMYPDEGHPAVCIERKRAMALAKDMIPRKNQGAWLSKLLGREEVLPCTVKQYRSGWWKFPRAVYSGIVVVGRLVYLIQSEIPVVRLDEEILSKCTVKTLEMPVGWFPSRG